MQDSAQPWSGCVASDQTGINKIQLRRKLQRPSYRHKARPKANRAENNPRHRSALELRSEVHFLNLQTTEVDRSHHENLGAYKRRKKQDHLISRQHSRHQLYLPGEVFCRLGERRSRSIYALLKGRPATEFVTVEGRTNEEQRLHTIRSDLESI